jgi:hypothetical protein
VFKLWGTWVMRFSGMSRSRVVQIGVVFFACVLVLLSLAQKASADEFAVSIDVYWMGATLSGNTCVGACNVPSMQFAASFDVNANGTLVPGTMSFLVTSLQPGIVDGTAYAYNATPPSFTVAEGAGGNFTLGAPYSWSGTGSEAGGVIMFLPPGCAYFGSTPCASGSWPPTGNTTLSASTVSINEFIFGDNPRLFNCWNSGCPAGNGEQNVADGGSVVITALPTPEPTSLTLLFSGLVAIGFLVKKARQ